MNIHEMMRLGLSGNVAIDPKDTPDYPYIIKTPDDRVNAEFDEQVKIHEEAFKQGLAWYLNTFVEE